MMCKKEELSSVQSKFIQMFDVKERTWKTNMET